VRLARILLPGLLGGGRFQPAKAEHENANGSRC